MPIWEYAWVMESMGNWDPTVQFSHRDNKTFPASSDFVKVIMRQVGGEGWELVGLYDQRYVFKRPLS